VLSEAGVTEVLLNPLRAAIDVMEDDDLLIDEDVVYESQ
jgi:hypothetical protein